MSDNDTQIFNDAEISVPPHDLHGDVFCQLWSKNPRLFLKLSNMLADGASARRVCAEALKHKVRMAENSVHRHYKLHLPPAIGKVRESKQFINNLRMLNKDIAPDDAAQEVQLLLLQKLTPRLIHLQEMDLKGLEIKELLGIIVRVSDSLSNAQWKAADIDLKQAKLQLTKFAAAKTGSEAKKIGLVIIQQFLRPYPELLAQVNGIINSPEEPIDARTERPAISA